MFRSYSELRKLETFDERFEYLRIGAVVGESTFGFDRYLNQMLYRSSQWLRARDEVILRDNGCDLGIEDRPIRAQLLIHHMNPITSEQIEHGAAEIFDPRFLICTTRQTHNAIHYGDGSLLSRAPIERCSGDTSLWARQ